MNKDIDYITILEESLEKKIKTLDRIIELNKMQYDSVQGETIDDELFNESISEKEKCIESIQELDKGFEMVYEHVREELMKYLCNGKQEELANAKNGRTKKRLEA